MRIELAHHVRPRRLRRTMTALATAVGVGVAMMVGAMPASADVPIGGWCYSARYSVQSVGSVAQYPVIPTRSFQNSSSGTTVTWSESYSDYTTHISTYSTTTAFAEDIDIEDIIRGVNRAQTRTTTSSITVNGTSSFSAPVPPQTTAYATYGPYKLQTSGVYSQSRYPCDPYSSYPRSTRSGALTAYSLTGVGWHYWDSNGSSNDL